MKKHGFTLIELLVVIAIIVVLIALIASSFGNWGSYGHVETFTAKVIRKYEFHTGETTDFRVDIKKVGATTIDTIKNCDDIFQSKYNSATIQANLLDQHWYSITVRGERQEYWSGFPNIMSISEVASPEPIKAELEY